ncbi:MAG: FtsX-like permease family protein, partial [Candidatus Eisenbacteria bacterium]|nr:FtsX-like permease family protein [Candidatus Latescibacterota bacterium]MBD3303309.1 FtsX-like permease family protein [Candidatus Eisenbacteria bacterium]
MRALRALRALLRLELREIRRHRGRSILILLLVAVPVAAVVGGATLARITERTPEERATRSMGRAALRIDVPGDEEARRRLRRLLPDTLALAEVFVGAETASVPGQRLRAKGVAADAETIEPPGLASGMLRFLRGRAPRNSGEVALSPVLLEGLGRAPGEEVTLSFGRARTISGVVVDPEDLDASIVLRTPAAVEQPATRLWLAAMPESEAATLAASIREAGFGAVTRAASARGEDGLASIVFLLGSIGFLEAMLVIASAFMVGLRRRQFEIGLVGSSGGSRLEIQGALVASAAWLASLGGILGVGTGIGVAAALHPFLDQWNQRWNGPFEAVPAHLAGAFLLGLVTAVVAAVLPARNVARVPVREALAGRRPITTPSRNWGTAGLALVGIGLGILFFFPRDDMVTQAFGAIGAPAFGILGFGACSPWILDRLGRRASR